MKKNIGYSFLVGALIAIGIYFSGSMHLSDERRNLIEIALLNNIEIKNAIGTYEKLKVKKVTKYFGDTNTQPYVKYLLHVIGDKDSVWVRLVINDLGSGNETVVITSIEK